jgi:N-acetylneuraminic acid mutarotase
MGGDSTISDECTQYDATSTYTAGIACGAPGIYGQMGVSNTGNTPGGRQGAVAWTDKSGNFWLFGGLGYAPGVGVGYFNDLWKFDPATLQWAWMGGSPTVPGFYEGQPAVYGELGTAAPGNNPGGRQWASAATDAAGNLWFFGGEGPLSQGNSVSFSDLWEYEISTGNWRWVSGSTSGKLTGVYGNLGEAAPSNTPGSREGAVSWVDTKGRFWLFGGQGIDSRGYDGYLNDFWQFNPTTQEWIWVGGSNLTQQNGNYGNPGDPENRFIPSSRYLAERWTDASGNFWLLGGQGVDSVGAYGNMNDLWKFNPTTSEWVWITGSKTNNYSYFGVGGVYGTLGSPAAANTPGGRNLAATWTDSMGNLWLFAGEGAGAGESSIGYSPNDMWRFQLSTSVLKKAATPTYSPAAGSYTTAQQVTLKTTTPYASIYYSTNGTSASPTWTGYTGPITVSASQTLSAIAIAPGFSASAPATAAYELPADAPVFSLPSGTYNEATVKLTCDTPGATIYYTTNGTTPTANSTAYSGQIVVSSSETIQAIAIATGSLNSAVVSAAYTIASKSTTANEWTWIKGSSTLGKNYGESGVYGTLGKFAATNLPGSRSGAALWTDKSGNQWLFGGSGQDATGNQGILNDLWERSATSGQWAWIAGLNSVLEPSSLVGVYGTQGVFAAKNYPGARDQATTWTDAQGNLWLFGGFGYDSIEDENYLNDLWEFNLKTHQWAWIGGASVSCPHTENAPCPQRGAYGVLGVPAAGNTPGGRQNSAGWADLSGNLWLFGGQGIDSEGDFNNLNDFWEFLVSDRLWVWMGGDETIGSQFGRSGVYGIQGVPGDGNLPGARYGSANWTDAQGHFWLFGGYGIDAEGKYGYQNDLWEFNASANEWTWVSGDNVLANSPISTGIYGIASGVYGAQGIPSPGNTPGGKFWSTAWVDKAGNFWLFAGLGIDAAGNFGDSNELWEFSPATHLWTWVSGSNQLALLDANYDYGEPGAYGALGVPYAGNAPGGRRQSLSWTDSTGNFWLMGGYGSDSTGTLGNLNDIWKLQPTAPGPPAAPPIFSLAGGDYTSAQTVTLTDATPGHKIYYSTNGEPPTTSSTLYAGPIKIGQTTVIQAIAVATGYSPSAPVQEIYIINQ